jgi:serine/threonine protein kinase
MRSLRPAARDTRLERTVAVKVLPEHIAAREDHRLRFEREARAVTSLNHPYIPHISLAPKPPCPNSGNMDVWQSGK